MKTRFFQIISLVLMVTMLLASFPFQAEVSAAPGLASPVQEESPENVLPMWAQPPAAVMQPATFYKVIAQPGVLDVSQEGITLWHDYGAFALYKVSAATLNQLSSATRSEIQVATDMDYIMLDAYPFNTQTDTFDAIPEPFRVTQPDGPTLHLIQFVGPIKDAWLQAINEAGATPIHYIANYGYLVWADDAARARLNDMARAKDFLQFSAPYQTYFKLGASLNNRLTRAYDQEEVVKVTIQMYDHVGKNATERLIAELLHGQLSPWTPVLDYQNVVAKVRAGDLATIAAQSDVFWIGEYFERERMDEVQDQILAGNLNVGQTGPSGPGYLAWLAGYGFSTDPDDYPIVDITDDGIGNGTVNSGDYTLHEFGNISNPTRLQYVGNCTSAADGGGPDGHGHINTSIVGSYDTTTGFPYQDPNGFNRGLGVSPYARLAGTRIFAPGFDLSACGGTDTGLIKHVQDAGAQIASNSWGCSGCAGSYDASSQAFDVGVRDADLTEAGNQELIFVFSAGNSGPGAGTVGTPGNGKNMITVGASENDRPSDEDGPWTDGCGIGPTGADNAMDIISFSSRGPSPGDRVKPEVIAPGTHIQGTASTHPSYNGSGVCDQYRPSGQTIFAASSGTSHSAPAVAGVSSLYYYWLGTHYGVTPSPALMKAYLIAHPTYLTGVSANDTLPSNNQGYGMPNMALGFDDTPRYMVNQTEVFDNSGENWTFSANVVDPGKPVRVVMAYTDEAGAVGTSPEVNDLNLEVTVGGNTYLGNNFSGQWSVTGGSADDDNNYEAVFLPAGASGQIEVTVTAFNIAGDGVPNTGDGTDQDFALVIYNASQEGIGFLDGTVYESGGAPATDPIASASVQATSLVPTHTGSATSGADGYYRMGLLTDTYTVTAIAYGYQMAQLTGVSVVSGTTTTQDIPLTPATMYVVSGTVTDTATGWPLYARVAIGGDPVNPPSPYDEAWTDPATGYYSVTLAEDISYTFDVEAWVDGYNTASRGVGPLTGDTTEDFGLDVDPSTCSAPGYEIVEGLFEDFESLFPPAGWTVIDNAGEGGVWDRNANNMADFGSGFSAAANAGSANSINWDTELRSPPIDMTAAATTTLTYASNFQDYAGNGDAWLDVNNGSGWTNLRYQSVDDPTGGTLETEDLSLYASDTITLRWRYTATNTSAWYWHIDDVNLGPICAPMPGGLVVGNVYDDNTSNPLVGAEVANEDGHTATTAATPDDANVDDGFYTVFSPHGSKTFTATMAGGYWPDVVTVTVVQSDTVWQDFYLPAPKIEVVPTSLSYTLELGQQFTQTPGLVISNTGTGALDFEFQELPGGFGPAVSGQPGDFTVSAPPDSPRRIKLSLANSSEQTDAPAAPLAILADVELVVDDGSAEDAIGLTAGGQFVWLNRFTPDPGDFPFTLDQISVLFGTSVTVGDDMELIIWEDTDGDGDPGTGANFLYAEWVTAQFNDLATWNVYTLTSPVTLYGPGDVLIGAVNRSGASGYNDYPAAIDQGTSQQRSWIGLYSAGDPPDPPTLPPDGTWDIIDNLGYPGNWTLRGSGFFGGLDIPWLSEDPISGTIPSSGTVDTDIGWWANVPEVDQPGAYYADLGIKSNDPLNPYVTLPVTMTVNTPATWGKLEGTVTSLGHCDANPAPLEDAELFIEGVSGMTWTLTTGISGTYSYWFDEAESPLTVTVTHPEHEVGLATGVLITGQMTTTLDFDLRWLEPCVGVEAPVLEAVLNMGMSTTLPMSITNTGAVSSGFKLIERDRGFLPTAFSLFAGYGEWLYRDEAGIPVQSNQRDETLAHPSAYRWQPAWMSPFAPSALNILIYADDSIHTAPNTFLDQALQALGLAYTAHYGGDWTGFEADLTGGGPWDLVLVGNDHYAPPASTLTALDNYVTGGGKLVFHSWTVGNDPGNTLWATLGFTWVSNDTDPPDPVYWWEQGHPIFTIPENVPEFTSLDGGIYGTYGQRVEPLAGFDPLAGYTTPGPDPNEAAMILSNDGRTVFKGFLDGQNSADLDADTVMDGVELWINLIDGIQVGFSGDVPWLFEDPITGTVAADTGFQLVDVTLDAAYVAQPGEYHATLNVNSDDPVNGKIGLPVTMTVNVPTGWGKLMGTVNSLGYCDVNLAPLDGAEVFIEDSVGMTWTLTTGVSGTYSYWLDQGDYTVTVSYADHLSDTAMVSVSSATTTTQNFDLRLLQPCVSAAPLSMETILLLGDSEAQTLTLTNDGAVASQFDIGETTRTLALNGPLATGGPDPFGYVYRDSDEPNGPAYEWVEIAPPAGGSGTAVGLTGMDDDHFWPLPLPFPFDFYGTDYITLAVATNGTVYFEDAYLGYSNTSIPGPNGYGVDTFIAHFWDDLVVSPGEVYYLDDGDRFIIEYYQVSGCCVTPDHGTWEIILFDNGSILFQYQDANLGDVSYNYGAGATVGIQGDTTTMGLQYSYNTPSLSDDMAICFAYPGESPDCGTGIDVPWLSEDPITGTVGADSFFDVAVTFTALPTMTFGTYTATLIVSTDDAVTPKINIPVTMTLISAARWEKEVTVNGVPTDAIPITVLSSDTLQIVDRVWVTHTGSTTFTLGETWGESLELTGTVDLTAGDVTSGTNWLTWDATDVASNTWHVLTKTFHVASTEWFFDTVTETLWVEGAVPQPDDRVLTFRHGDVCWPVSIDDLQSDSPVTVGDTMYFSATASGDPPITYTWDFGGAGAPGGTDTHPTFLYDASGSYTVTLDVANGCPSTDTATIQVTVNPVCVEVTTVTLSITNTGTIYTDTLLYFSADIAPDGAIKPYTYTVDYDEGTGPSTPATSSDDPLALNHTFVTTGSYDVEIAVWNCDMTEPATATAPVVVSEYGVCVDLTGIAILGDTSGTPGDYTFTTSYTPANASDIIAYLWDNGDTTDTSIRSLTVGTYTLAVTATNCTSALVTDTHEIVISAAPVCTEVTSVNLVYTNTGTIYTDTLVYFSADIEPDDASKPYTYTIDYDDGTTPVTATSSDDPLAFSHTFVATGSYDVEIAVWNCDMTEPVTATALVVVSEYGVCVDLSGITIAGDASGAPGIYTFTTSYQLTYASIPISYLWDDGGASAALIRSLGVGTYTLMVTATNCTSAMVTDTHEIIISGGGHDIYLPLVMRSYP